MKTEKDNLGYINTAVYVLRSSCTACHGNGEKRDSIDGYEKLM